MPDDPRVTIVQAQLGEKPSQTVGYNILQTDGTTKFGEHYATYDVRTSETEISYALGLRHVFFGSAQDTLETLKEILDDIDSVQLALGKNAVSAKVVAKIKNTMSDRHIIIYFMIFVLRFCLLLLKVGTT